MTKQKSAARTPKAQHNYLTKRVLIKAAKDGVKNAVEQTMRVMGYVVIAHNGWIVKQYPDGSMEKVAKVKTVNRSRTIALD